MFKNLPRIFIPVMWFTQKADIDDNLASVGKLAISATAIGWGMLFGFAAIGLLIIVIGLVVTVRHGWDSNDTKELITHSRKPSLSPSPLPES
ncbi:hypothetical protein PR048_003427 [Dryococelus australis]|uniref:Uncharacterized protein n=1 Tax=Dryococelus australis TaxID=614101 RepID=A0ABQ9IN34_9NEOP|nr:hypothetical protein PR048_003427 [Dryococelus australis]